MPESANPCVFKKACRECVVTYEKDRPAMCVSIRCDKYTPCKRCGNNRVLADDEMCAVCTRTKAGSVMLTDAQGQVVEIPEQAVKNFRLKDDPVTRLPSADAPAMQLDEAILKARSISISMPGVPPAEYNDSEKDYYNSQWKEYAGYYRDPTANVILHNIIVLEIELNFTVSFIIQTRGADTTQAEQQRSRLIKNLEQLRNQLPEKEALDMSDDEKSLSMIYERYCEVNKLRKLGSVSRVVSPEAIALAPTLTFPLSPGELLRRLSYRQVDIVQACDAVTLADLPNDPKKALEFFGFYLDEKFAMPVDSASTIDEEVDLPDAEEVIAAADEAISTMQEEASNRAKPGPMSGPPVRNENETDNDFSIITDADE